MGQINSKVPLQGAELEEYLEKERVKKEKETAKKAAEERRKRILEADEGESEDEESDSDSDDENEEQDMSICTMCIPMSRFARNHADSFSLLDCVIIE